MVEKSLKYVSREEIPVRQTGVGRQFELSVSSLSEPEMPERFLPNPRNWYAILSTNEITSRPLEVPDRNNPVDGYIVGVGFGSIFRFLDFYDSPNPLPKAVICTDVMSEVVLAGRVARTKARSTDNLRDFLRSVTGTTAAEIDTVIGEEPNPVVAGRLSSAAEYVQKLFRCGHFPVGQGTFLNDNMLRILDKNFGRIHRLAREDNIGLSLVSVTNPSFLSLVTGLDGYAGLRNVVYVSNIIDHITNRGRELEKADALLPLSVLRTPRGSFCVDTTEQDLDYELRVRKLPPRYSEKDFPWRRWSSWI